MSTPARFARRTGLQVKLVALLLIVAIEAPGRLEVSGADACLVTLA